MTKFVLASACQHGQNGHHYCSQTLLKCKIHLKNRNCGGEHAVCNVRVSKWMSVCYEGLYAFRVADFAGVGLADTCA